MSSLTNIYSTDELEQLLVRFGNAWKHGNAADATYAKQAIAAHYARQEAEIRLDEQLNSGASWDYGAVDEWYQEDGGEEITKEERIAYLKSQLTPQAEQERKER